MISNVYDEYPVFSQPKPPPQLTLEPHTPDRDTGTARKRIRVCMRDLVFPVGDVWYPLSTLYEFPENEQALCWESITRYNIIRFPNQTTYRNTYNSNEEVVVTEPTNVRSDSLVIIHSVLELANNSPKHIFLPSIGANKKIAFTAAVLRRKLADRANVEVAVSVGSVNPFFTPANIKAELEKTPRFKASISDVRRQRAEALFRQQLLSQSPTAQPQLQFGSPQRPLGAQSPIAYRFQNLTHSGEAQVNQVRPHQSPPPVRLPVSTTQQSQVKFQKGKVALCNNCGVHSPNLITCSRCGKSNMGPTLDDVPSSRSDSQKKLAVKRNISKRHESRNEVVDLSSDDNEDSQEAIVSNKCTVESSHLLSSLLSTGASKQNGKEPPTPEEVIALLSDMASKSNGCAMFTMVTCSYIRIGTYMVVSGNGFPIRTTIAEAGLYFELPAYNTGETKQVAIPNNQILTLYGHLDASSFYARIDTGPKFAAWIRKALNMDTDENGVCYFCPMHADPSRKEIMMMFSDVDQHKAAVLQRLYHDKYKPYEEYVTKKDLSESTDMRTKGVLVKVEWRGPNCTAQEKLDPQNPATFSTPAQPPVFSKVDPLGVSQKLFHYPLNSSDAEANFFTENSITINSGDVHCLGDLQYLNDQVMDFWMRCIVDDLKPEIKQKAYVFNTFFYKRLTTKPLLKRKSTNSAEYDTNLSHLQKKHSRVKNWTKKVDIFEKDFLFIPVNENSHWFLAVICFPGLIPWTDEPRTVSQPTAAQHSSEGRTRNTSPADPATGGSCDKTQYPTETQGDNSDNQNNSEEAMDTSGEKNQNGQGSSSIPPPTDSRLKSPALEVMKNPCIIVFDSLGPESRPKLFTNLREYLQAEHDARKGPGTKVFSKSSLPGHMPNVPFQLNGWDCGIYVLTYLEMFFRRPILNYTSTRSLKLKNWFRDDEVVGKRQQIYDFIVLYVKTNFPENSHYIQERSVQGPEEEGMDPNA